MGLFKSKDKNEELESLWSEVKDWEARYMLPAQQLGMGDFNQMSQQQQQQQQM